MSFKFSKNLNRIVVNAEEFPGITRIAKVVATDIESVFGGKVNVTGKAKANAGDIVVDIDSSAFGGKYQCYRISSKDGIISIIGADLLG